MLDYGLDVTSTRVVDAGRARSSGVVDVELREVLTAGVVEANRALSELREQYAPRVQGLEFGLSRPAAAVAALGDALEFASRELGGQPQGPLVEQWFNETFAVAHDNMHTLADLGYLSVVELLPSMWLPGLRLEELAGRAAFTRWWHASGEAMRAYLGVTRALVAIVRAEHDARELPGSWDRNLFVSDDLFASEDRAKREAARVLSYRISGVFMRLVGFQYGVSLFNGDSDARRIELGIRELLELFTKRKGAPA
jgi:hypothetical protein